MHHARHTNTIIFNLKNAAVTGGKLLDGDALLRNFGLFTFLLIYSCSASSYKRKSQLYISD